MSIKFSTPYQEIKDDIADVEQGGLQEDQRIKANTSEIEDDFPF